MAFSNERKREIYKEKRGCIHSKKEQRIYSIAYLLVELGISDGGDEIKMRQFGKTIPDGFSDVLIVSNPGIAKYIKSCSVKTSVTTTGRDIIELRDNGYIQFICTHSYGENQDANCYIVNIRKILAELIDYYHFSANDYHCCVDISEPEIKSPETAVSETKPERNKRLSGQELKDHKKQICNTFFATEDRVFTNHILPIFSTLKISEEMHFLDESDGSYEHSRLYSKICSTKNPHKEDGIEYKGEVRNAERYNYLCDYFGCGHKEEMQKLIDSGEYIEANSLFIDDFHPYDFHSMIVRLIHDLSHSGTMDAEADGYKIISKAVFGTEDYRDLVKDEIQSIIQKPEKIEYRCIQKNTLQRDLKKQNDDRLLRALEIERLTGLSYSDCLYSICTEYFKCAGLNLKANYYRFESAIYILMHKWFEDRGFKIAPNVYDCFAGPDLNEDRVIEAYKYAVSTVRSLYEKEYGPYYLTEKYTPYFRELVLWDNHFLLLPRGKIWGVSSNIQELIDSDLIIERSIVC